MLAEMQGAFRRALLQGDEAAALSGIAEGGLPPRLRLSVYRNNALGSLSGVLAAAYPALERLLGKDNFRLLARAFVAAHPPNRPHLSSYGAELPAFLATFPPTAGYPFLPDLGRLEWARNETLFAADAPALTGRNLEGLAPERLSGLRLPWHPATRLIESAYAIERLWLADALGRGVAAGAQSVLVTRSAEGAVLQRRIGQGDVALLRAFASGEDLTAAAVAAFAAQPDFDLQAALADHLTQATFTEPKEPA
ncbi:HvfC/BufC N-terminal domain-containing protein [Algihabitans albus]|uniref:HvfC/BufC N-terminal domain-containing protein n=1 Tax=Algihabitans albus TaxID=2164067 RepID=UPI000E5DA4E7|nr:DNA-binding domain-containing protein [Algihabitans albus]